MQKKHSAQDTVGTHLHLDPRFVKNSEELKRRSLGGTRILNGTPVKRGDYPRLRRRRLRGAVGLHGHLDWSENCPDGWALPRMRDTHFHWT